MFDVWICERVTLGLDKMESVEQSLTVPSDTDSHIVLDEDCSQIDIRYTGVE